MAAMAIIPLYLRMGCVHVILIYGTNNAHFTELTDEEIRMRSIASGLVLASRVLYAATYVSSPFDDYLVYPLRYGGFGRLAAQNELCQI